MLITEHTEQTDFEHCRAQIQTFYCEQASTEAVTLFRSTDL